MGVNNFLSYTDTTEQSFQNHKSLNNVQFKGRRSNSFTIQKKCKNKIISEINGDIY